MLMENFEYYNSELNVLEILNMEEFSLEELKIAISILYLKP